MNNWQRLRWFMVGVILGMLLFAGLGRTEVDADEIVAVCESYNPGCVCDFNRFSNMLHIDCFDNEEQTATGILN